MNIICYVLKIYKRYKIKNDHKVFNYLMITTITFIGIISDGCLIIEVSMEVLERNHTTCHIILGGPMSAVVESIRLRISRVLHSAMYVM